ncbi:helix-turn-helix domain-containing protein [Bacteroides cellulosilyticus]|jgi:AraC-like DNA-binding protein|uniref:helix-turn-helix domain-containing protein n=1 Tax=Bacteroides cellulosilyticus TaxID=246787 RepID=UPI000E49D49E|nr:helix-turn-helix transcriptional regulator [Bacteroides cellulosilyticus]RGU30548.1 AraC family transcriptional regulator [Bacteroides cellulosilyticus]
MEGINISYFMNGAAFMFFGYVSFRLLTHRPRSRIQRILGLTLAFWALLEFKDILLYFPSLKTERLVNSLLFIDGWAVAACSFYLLELTAPGWLNWKKIFLLFSPYLIFTIAYLCTFYAPIFPFYFGFILLYSAVIVLIVTFAARRYQRYIHNNYSYSEHIDVAWLKKATLILAICLLTWVYTSIHITGWGDTIYYISSVVLWFVIIHYSAYQISIPMPNNLKGNLLAKEPVEENETTGTEQENGSYYAFREELLKVMEEQQLYLNPKLTISDVANAIGTNRTYLSSYFNNKLNITFYDYINNLRIEKTGKQLLATYPYTMNIDEIAERSGFNSTSTFRRAFFKNTGMTPLQYRKSIQK